MRRQKCDRNVPCGRCVKRGDADKCSRAWPEGGYDPKVHRIYPRTSGDHAGSSPTITDTSPAATIHNASDTPIHPSMRTPASAHSRPSPQTQHASHPTSLGPAPTNGPVTDIDNAATTLEFLTWGRSKLSDYDLKALELLKEPHNSGPALVPKDSGPDWDASSGFGGTGAAQISFLQLLLPSRRQVYQLVEYHVNSILWYHGCFHGPTFFDELNEVYKAPGGLQIRDMDLRWAAFLFSIMAASTTCASEQLASSWGFKKHERAKLTRQWYKATVTCLNLADYMWRHHIYSVQAIAVLTMSAHVLGFSNTQSTLLGAALKIAQGLGLQRLGPEDETSGSLMLTAAQRDKAIKRETGRRVWAQLCIQDWFSIPFSEMYSIQKSHFSSPRPSHVDDATMQPLPEDFPAVVSFPNVLVDIAGVMPQIHDAIISSNTLYTKYEQVLHYDDKMRTLASDGLPRFFSMREPISPDWPAFVPWARRSLTICFAHKIIMIHRAFLGRSFTESAFDFTRRTCMAAAKTILKEARQVYDEEGPMLWIDQAFMVAAGITLALDIFHRKPNEPEYEEHRKLVDNTISMLGKFEHSMIALRGIRLLGSLLAEQARLTADQTMENYRKRTHDAMNDHSQPKKQKFNVPKFVENFVGNDSFTHSLRNANKGIEPSMDLFEPEARTPVRTPAPQDPVFTSDFGYETFEQLFPPHTGISNNFLFEDLLNFDI